MAFIESVEDTLDDFKKSVGDKGFMFIGIGLVVLFVIVLLKQKSNTGEVVVATGITSYPDTVTNANVIISTLQNSIAYTEGEIKEDIAELSQGVKDFREENKDYFNSTQEFINDKANQTNEYMKEGFAKQEDLLSKGFDSLSYQMDNGFTAIMSGQDEIQEQIQNNRQELHNATHEIIHNMNSGFQASHLATGLQMEQTEMKIRNQLEESTVRIGM